MIENLEKISVKDLLCATDGELIFGDENMFLESISTSSGEVLKNTLFIPIKGERFDAHDFLDDAVKNGAIGYLTEKDIEIKNAKFAVKVLNTKKALMDIAHFNIKRNSADVVALTGSVGKTTTKEFVANVLGEQFNTIKTQKNYNNEIGMPFTAFSINSKTEKAVIEMGMSNFGEIEKYSLCANPDTAIITNIGVSHIEYLKSREGILKAKSEIFDGMADDGEVFLNGDDDLLRTLKGKLKQKTYFFGFENPDCDFLAKDIKADDKGITFKINGEDFHINVLGIHNVYNALAAYAVGKKYDISSEKIREGLKKFESDGIRQSIFEKNGIKFINDCYNASPQSVKSSIDVLCLFGGRKIAVLGDMAELGINSSVYHAETGKYAEKKGIDLLITVGKMSEETHNAANINKVHFDTNDEVSDYLKKNAKSGDVILIKGSRCMKMEEILKKYES